MSTLTSAINAASSALDVQRARLEVAVSNLANAESTRSENGGPYRRREVVIEAVNQDGGVPGASGVRVAGIVEDQSPFERRFEPNNVDADETGFVSLPNVDVPAEMVDMLAAWVDDFPVLSIEDALDEDDWSGWHDLTTRLGARVRHGLGRGTRDRPVRVREVSQRELIGRERGRDGEVGQHVRVRARCIQVPIAPAHEVVAGVRHGGDRCAVPAVSHHLRRRARDGPVQVGQVRERVLAGHGRGGTVPRARRT